MIRLTKVVSSGVDEQNARAVDGERGSVLGNIVRPGRVRSERCNSAEADASVQHLTATELIQSVSHLELVKVLSVRHL